MIGCERALGLYHNGFSTGIDREAARAHTTPSFSLLSFFVRLTSINNVLYLNLLLALSRTHSTMLKFNALALWSAACNQPELIDKQGILEVRVNNDGGDFVQRHFRLLDNVLLFDKAGLYPAQEHCNSSAAGLILLEEYTIDQWPNGWIHNIDDK